MKAILVSRQLPLKRTHDLTALLDQVTTINPLWDALRDAAKL